MPCRRRFEARLDAGLLGFPRHGRLLVAIGVLSSSAQGRPAWCSCTVARFAVTGPSVCEDACDRAHFGGAISC